MSSGHPVIRDHEVDDRAVVHPRECLRRVRRRLDLETFATERSKERGEHRGLVVDEQHDRSFGHLSSPFPRPLAGHARPQSTDGAGDEDPSNYVRSWYWTFLEWIIRVVKR